MMLDFWGEIAALERRMDDVVREFLGTRTRLAHPALPLFVTKPFVPVTDVFDRDGDLVVRMEIPGIDPAKDLTIGIHDGELTVKGERKQRAEVEEDRYYRMEAAFGTFERIFPIPKDVGEAAVEATYEDGVLQVVVKGAAKAEEEAETKPIPVKVATPKKAA
jgi:HSP20 family protein